MINIVELFSGIGSQAKAFERISKKRNIKFNILNTCEWDVHAIVAYNNIHKNTTILPNVSKLCKDEILEELKNYTLSNDGKAPISKQALARFNLNVLQSIYSSIIRTNNFVNIQDLKGEMLPDNIDVLTYSFPCQDLSTVGALHGYNKGIDRDAHNRSGLLWEVERILLERKKSGLSLPKFLLLENVTALEASRHKKNFEEWQECLKKLGYVNKINRLYAPDFGIPQNRKRLLMLSVYVGDDKNKINIVNNYFENHDLNNKEYIKCLAIRHQPLSYFLRTNYDNMIYKNEANWCQPNNTKSRQVIWNKNSKLIDENGIIKQIVQTITTKQDRHPNSGNIYYDSKRKGKAKYRFLTPRECFLLMGFDEIDYEVLIKNNLGTRRNHMFFSRDILYKLAGNSIVVNMLEAIFNQVIELIDIID